MRWPGMSSDAQHTLSLGLRLGLRLVGTTRHAGHQVPQLYLNPAATPVGGNLGCQSIGMGQPSLRARTRQRDATLQATCKQPQGLNRPRQRKQHETQLKWQHLRSRQKQYAQQSTSDRLLPQHHQLSTMCLDPSMSWRLSARSIEWHQALQDLRAHVPVQPRACFQQVRHAPARPPRAAMQSSQPPALL